MAFSGHDEPDPLSQKEHPLSDFLTHNQSYTAGSLCRGLHARYGTRRADKVFVSKGERVVGLNHGFFMNDHGQIPSWPASECPQGGQRWQDASRNCQIAMKVLTHLLKE
jgi:hypothetical protein